MEGGHRGEREANARGSRFVLPEDGYEWKKYGQKFIKNISKNRNYFKCRRSDCFARKRAEWSTLEPESIRVVYAGVHNHALPAAESGSLRSRNPSWSVNQYDLWTQVFENQCESKAEPFAPATITAGAYLVPLFFLARPASFRAFPHEFPPCESPQATTIVPPCGFQQAATMLPPCEFPQAPYNMIFAEPVSPVFPKYDSTSDFMTDLQTDHGLHADPALHSYIPPTSHAWETNFPNMTMNAANRAAGDAAATSEYPSHVDVAATTAAHSYMSAYGHFQHGSSSSTGKEESTAQIHSPATRPFTGCNGNYAHASGEGIA